MGLLAFHAAVFHELAGIAFLELDGVAPLLAAIGARVAAATGDSGTTHHPQVDESYQKYQRPNQYGTKGVRQQDPSVNPQAHVTSALQQDSDVLCLGSWVLSCGPRRLPTG
mmetsp:Transcript_25193/g.59940  ORF Transcript_25193/g.59940 Transcript_25193/m.59940 type:complete len:111 (-) Transcript_25193:344-676(-)